jgi:hypothetical protein
VDSAKPEFVPASRAFRKDFRMKAANTVFVHAALNLCVFVAGGVPARLGINGWLVPKEQTQNAHAEASLM